jgi:small subunit ribosomal protein S14
MAKTAVINRNLKRQKTVKKFAKKRTDLIATINNQKLSDEARMDARHLMQQLPRNASPSQCRRIRRDR